MTVRSWERMSGPPEGWKDRVLRPFDEYGGTPYDDSAIYRCDGSYYLALALPAENKGDGKGTRIETVWYELEVGGGDDALYNRGGAPYDGLSSFIEDMMGREQE